MENQFSQSKNQLTRCVKSWYFSLLLQLQSAFFWSLAPGAHSALQDLQHGLRALAASLSGGRIYLGLVLMLVVAPLAGVGYQLFDQGVRVQGWFYVNSFYLFFELCPHISLLSVLTGIFFLFPEKSKRAFFLIIPAGFHIAKMLWLIMADSNEDFYRIVPSSIFVTGILFALVLFITFDWLTSLHFHKKARHYAAYEGLMELDAMGAISESELLVNLRKENRLFKVEKSKS